MPSLLASLTCSPAGGCWWCVARAGRIQLILVVETYFRRLDDDVAAAVEILVLVDAFNGGIWASVLDLAVAIAATDQPAEPSHRYVVAHDYIRSTWVAFIQDICLSCMCDDVVVVCIFHLCDGPIMSGICQNYSEAGH